jgi:TP901 family phage tail tape measure protein
MSDVNANIGININASSALAELKALQRQIATFHQQVAKGSASAAIAQKGLQTNLLNAINATGKFHAQMGLVRTSTESFTHALETNKLSMGQYFKYAAGSTKTFGKLFKSEFDTIAKVAQERVKKMQTQYIKMGKDAQGATRAMSITPHSLNMKDAATQIAIAAQKQAIFNQLVRQGSTNLLNFGKNTQWAGRQLMVGFSVPLLYLGTVAGKVFMDLEKQAIRFKRVYGSMFTTSDETTKALADIQLLAKEFTKYGVAVADTVKMAADAAAMGKTGAELTAQVAEATRLAVLGGVEQEQALETTISLTNAFGVAAKDLTSKINFLNAVENQTVVSIEDLTIAIPKAGPVIQQLGGDVEDLAFFLTAMKEGGINASEGANALKSGLASLINPSKKAEGILGDLGINIRGIVEANKGDIRSTVIGFSQALDTLDPLNRARAIEQLFGKFQFARLSTLFQNVTKDGTQASRVLQLAGASVEELAIISERELKTVENAVGVNFRESIEKLKLTLIPIGEAFLKALTPVVKVVGNVLDKFNNLGEGTKKFLVIATGLVGFIGPVLLMTFGLLANGLANIIKLFLALRVGFLKMSGDSSNLAATTNYLTAEQLEATTVAASLNQAHTRLTQQFELETGAVSALRSAYVAATVAAAKFAMANPGMMAGNAAKAAAGVKGGVKNIPFSYAKGATYVPGTGNKDSVASMLTPGEAVIPAPVAQDPQFQPIIDAMVNGKLQGFNGGTGEVTQVGKNKTKMSSKDAFTHVGKSESLLAEDYIKQTPGLTEYDKARIRSLNAITMANSGQSGTVLNYGGLGFSFDSELNNQLAKPKGVAFNVFEKEWLSQGPEKWDATEKREIVKNLHGTDNKIIDDNLLTKIKEEAAKNAGRVTDDIVKNSFRDLPAEAKSTATYKSMLAVLDAKAEYGLGKGLSHNPDTLKRYFEKAVGVGSVANLPVVIINGDALEYNGKPTPLDEKGNPKKLSSVLGIHPDFPLPKNAHVVVERIDTKKKRVVSGSHIYDTKLGTHLPLGRGSSKRNKVGLRPELGLREEVKETRKRLSKKSLEEMKRIDAEVRSSSMAKVKPTDFGKQIAKSAGYSFPGDRSIGGVYEKPDGTRVFVKPMVDEKSARAELNINKIHKAIGLTAPEQVMRTMTDPNNKRRKLIVLESAFDPRFAEEKMTGKFTKKQYFKQLTASLLRGDKDLKRGNLSGNIVTDPGAAGVFDRASGRRDYSANINSMLGQAEINLLGAPGGRGLSKDFALSTANIPKGMTADQYHRAMIAEIERITPIVKETLRSIPMTDPNEAKAYRDMYRRLVKGKYTDWRGIHKMHSAVEPAFVTNKESLLDEKTGKIEKIKGEKKPKGAKPDTGKLADSKFTRVPRKKRVVKTPPKSIGKVFFPGYEKAPAVGSTAISFSDGSTTQSQIAEKTRVAQSKLVESINESTDENKKVTKETKNLGPKITTMANTFGMVAIGASFLPGKIGELAHKILPLAIGLQVLTMLLPMLKTGILNMVASMTPWGRALAAIVTVLAAGTLIQKIINDNNIKIAKKQSDYIDSISATTEKMKKIAALTNTFSASEVMSIKRQNASSDKFTKNYDRAGQQFGTSFAASEVGKEIFKGFQDDLLKSGTGPAVKSFALQLSGLVSDGVITGIQAGDIARQVAVDFQDMSLYPKIVGDLTSIIGPDGSDILKDPIRVRLEIVKESQDNIKNIISGLTESASSDGIRGIFNPKGFLNKIGTNKSIASAAGAASVQNLEITQAQIDATNYEYDKKLLSLNVDLKAAKTAKAKLDIQNQIKEATDKNLEDNAKLNKSNADNLKVMQDAFKLTKNDSGVTAAFMEGARQQARAKVKGTQSEPFLDPMLKLAAGTGSKSLELKITALAGSGTNPLLLTNLMGIFKGDNEGLTKNLDLMVTTHGAGEIQTLLSNLNIEKLDDKTKKQLFIDINLVKDKTQFDDLNSTLAILNTMPKDFDINAFLKGDAIGKLRTLTGQLNKVNNIKDVSVKAVVDLIATENGKGGPGKAGADKGFIAALEAVKANFDWIKSLPENQQKTAMLTVITAFQEITPEQMKAETQKRLKAAGGAMTVENFLNSPAGQAKIREDLAMQAAKPQYAPAQIKPKVPKGGPTGGDTKGSRDTTLDDLLLKLKLTRNASINAEGGLKELKRVFADGLLEKGFVGLSQALLDQSGNLDFINFVGGLDEATKKAYINTEFLEKGIIKLSNVGELAKKAYDAGAVGEYNLSTKEAIATIAAQRGEFKKLTNAGLENVEAAEMLTDANFALALSHTTNTKDVDTLIAAYKELKKVQKAYADDQLTPLQRAQKGFDEIGQKVNKFFSLSRQAVEGNYARKIFDQEKLVQEAQDTVNAIEKEIDGIQTGINAKEAEIQNKVTIPLREFEEAITKIQEEISTKFDEPIAVFQEEASDLSNDLTLIDKAAGAINKKYDAQEEALNKISEINQDLITQEKQRISLADALSQGDISAAAQIAQDIRSTAAQKAASNTGDLLSVSREQEIANLRSASGQTRLEIEQRQFVITQEIYKLEEGREILEASIATIKKDKIKPLDDIKKAILIDIRNEEDKIYAITNGTLLKAQQNLRIKQDSLIAIENEKQAELDKLNKLELEWIEVQAGIAAAEAETINLQGAITEAIRLAKELAAIFAGMGKFNNLKTSGGSTGQFETSYTPPQDTPADEAALDKFIATVTELDQAQADYEAGLLTGNSTIINALLADLKAKQKAYDATLPTVDPNMRGGGGGGFDMMAMSSGGMVPRYMAAGGMAAPLIRSERMPIQMSYGGMVPKYFAVGGMSRGTDIIPAMLTPGEFVMSKYAVDSYGVDKMKAINKGSYEGEKVYNYNLSVNVKSDANPQDIARVVMTQIRQVDSQRIRTQRD